MTTEVDRHCDRAVKPKIIGLESVAVNAEVPSKIPLAARAQKDRERGRMPELVREPLHLDKIAKRPCAYLLVISKFN